jgi:hypothetical protein
MTEPLKIVSKSIVFNWHFFVFLNIAYFSYLCKPSNISLLNITTLQTQQISDFTRNFCTLPKYSIKLMIIIFFLFANKVFQLGTGITRSYFQYFLFLAWRIYCIFNSMSAQRNNFKFFFHSSDVYLVRMSSVKFCQDIFLQF